MDSSISKVPSVNRILKRSALLACMIALVATFNPSKQSSIPCNASLPNGNRGVGLLLANGHCNVPSTNSGVSTQRIDTDGQSYDGRGFSLDGELTTRTRFQPSLGCVLGFRRVQEEAFTGDIDNQRVENHLLSSISHCL